MQQQTRLRADIRNFLSNELHTGRYPHVILDNVRVDYNELSQIQFALNAHMALTLAYGKTCRALGPLTFVYGHENYDNLPASPRNMMNDWNKQQWDQCVADGNVKYIVVTTRLFKPQGNFGHRVFLLFDKVTKTCWPFDPQFVAGELNNVWFVPHIWRTFQARYQTREPWGGFRIVSVSKWATNRTRSLQTIISEAEEHLRCKDVCVHLSNMILLLCLRFDVPRPGQMASIFRDAYGNDSARITIEFIKYLSLLLNRINVINNPGGGGNQAVLRRLFNPHLQQAGNRVRCIVKLLGRAKQCSRESCPGDVYCWQHANKTREHGAAPRSCKNPVPPLPPWMP